MFINLDTPPSHHVLYKCFSFKIFEAAYWNNMVKLKKRSFRIYEISLHGDRKSFCYFAQNVVPVQTELTLGHLGYCYTDSLARTKSLTVCFYIKEHIGCVGDSYFDISRQKINYWSVVALSLSRRVDMETPKVTSFLPYRLPDKYLTGNLSFDRKRSKHQNTTASNSTATILYYYRPRLETNTIVFSFSSDLFTAGLQLASPQNMLRE